jgi:xylulose-5-phosphate/fructose-6-phosphate phosphoketolase
MQFAELFTESVDVIFAFHGFPGAIHQVLHGRPDADRFHVRGYIEEGTTTTSFDMTALNRVTRYHLVMDAITSARRIPAGAGQLLAWCEEKLAEHNRYVVEHLEDLPEIRNWHLPTP